jgi:hypothetical protein
MSPLTGQMTMNLATLKTSLSQPEPPSGLSSAVQALWWDAKGNWDKAHECAQAQEDAAGALVHAYLHRKEGDLDNAGYWYRRAKQPVATVSLSEEWDEIAASLLR